VSLRSTKHQQPFLDRISFRDSYLATREVKAQKILKVLRAQGLNLSGASLADIGCSRGHITERLAAEFAFTVGVDLDREVPSGARQFLYVQADGCLLPLATGAFDVVLANHVLEHVSSPERLLNEVWRILKPGGLCYLACPNRLSLMEPHYRLPFLSWMPRPLADRYVRWCGRGDRYLDHMPTYWLLKQLTRQFRVQDQTVRVLKNPEQFLEGDPLNAGLNRFVAHCPSWILKTLLPFAPVWILILHKEGVEASR